MRIADRSASVHDPGARAPAGCAVGAVGRGHDRISYENARPGRTEELERIRPVVEPPVAGRG